MRRKCSGGYLMSMYSGYRWRAIWYTAAQLSVQRFPANFAALKFFLQMQERRRENYVGCKVSTWFSKDKDTAVCRNGYPRTSASDWKTGSLLHPVGKNKSLTSIKASGWDVPFIRKLIIKTQGRILKDSQPAHWRTMPAAQQVKRAMIDFPAYAWTGRNWAV